MKQSGLAFTASSSLGHVGASSDATPDHAVADCHAAQDHQHPSDTHDEGLPRGEGGRREAWEGRRALLRVSRRDSSRRFFALRAFCWGGTSSLAGFFLDESWTISCMNTAEATSQELAAEIIARRQPLSRRVVIQERPDVVAALERMAVEQGHSLSAEVRAAVRAHLRGERP
jgi:hypothetical protein